MVRILYHPSFATSTMVAPEYTKLKDLITIEVGMSDVHTSTIYVMKSLYQKQINSVRKYEQIETVGQLLKILEKRDVLSEDDILPLKVLAQQLPNNTEMLNAIAEYEELYARKQIITQHDIKKEEKDMEQQVPPPVDGGKYSSFQDGISVSRRNMIIKTVAEEIGPQWRNLARYLGIYEYKIDEIQCLGITHEEKAMQIIEIYRAKADRQRWFFHLMDSLEKAHRCDLSDKIKVIVTMNI